MAATSQTSPHKQPPVSEKTVEEAKTIVKSVGNKRDGQQQLESAHYKNFLEPMQNELEKTVAATNAILDKISKDMDTERKLRYKKKLQSHIPEELQGGGKKEEEIMKLVDQLIFYREVNNSSDEVQINDLAQLRELNETAKLTVIAHNLAAHFTTLPPVALERAAAKLESDCRLWMSRLFRFKNSMPLYHDPRFEGLARVGQLVLHAKYSKYFTEGFEALYSRPPVIYISAAAPPGLGQYLCHQLRLPHSCACTVPCNTLFGSSSKMDVALLEKLIQDDISAAKTPAMIIAYAGTPVVGHVDNLQRLQEIARTNGIWLHVDGSHLATLAMFSTPSSIESAMSCDSMTLDFSTWLGIPTLPYITLFKDSDQAAMESSGLANVEAKVQLKCLPLWMCLQSLGHDGVVGKIKFSCELAKTLFDNLDKMNTVKQISREKNRQEKEMKNVRDLISKSVNALLVFEVLAPTVVFRYTEDATSVGSIASYSSTKVEDPNEERDMAYFDALNTWLAESLQTSHPQVPISLVEVEKEGICLRYAPLETAQVSGTSKDDVEQFMDTLKSNLSVLSSTTRQRKRFRTLVSSHSSLQLIDLDSWAGLGAVRHIPQVYADRLGELTDKEKIEINDLNLELVNKLKAQDRAFSTGQTESGIVCVRFGLITSETNVDELVSLVHNTGIEVEESCKFLESMSELILKGIDEASKELEKENVEKLMNEGVLRQVPVVSSLLNWFSPVKEQVKGRTFNLTSGRIIPSTEVYKHHMQLQESGDASSLAPPGSPREHPQANGPGSFELPSQDDESLASTDAQAGGIRQELSSDLSSPPDVPVPAEKSTSVTPS